MIKTLTCEHHPIIKQKDPSAISFPTCCTFRLTVVCLMKLSNLHRPTAPPISSVPKLVWDQIRDAVLERSFVLPLQMALFSSAPFSCH